jgi:hypothetical protein
MGNTLPVPHARGSRLAGEKVARGCRARFTQGTREPEKPLSRAVGRCLGYLHGCRPPSVTVQFRTLFKRLLVKLGKKILDSERNARNLSGPPLQKVKGSFHFNPEENDMQFGEAIILSAYRRNDGTQEVELNAVCPASNYERLNVVLGATRVAVPLDRPERGAFRRFKVNLKADAPLNEGEKVPVEFFYPGEQAGVHCRDLRVGSMN